nr:uncharacterized protein LOC105844676 [Hydra vulgaris]
MCLNLCSYGCIASSNFKKKKLQIKFFITMIAPVVFILLIVSSACLHKSPKVISLNEDSGLSIDTVKDPTVNEKRLFTCDHNCWYNDWKHRDQRARNDNMFNRRCSYSYWFGRCYCYGSPRC